MQNRQQPEKPNYTGIELDVHSIFRTIQGEGPFAGRRSIFIRLAGCNLQCPGCDTEYTMGRQFMTPAQILRTIEHAHGHLVVITGGEPFRQNIAPLVETLADAGFQVQIETNGTLFVELPWEKVTVICSPKTGSVNKQLQPHIAHYKYVLDAGSVGADGLPVAALGHPNSGVVARPHAGFSGIIYLQPMDTKRDDRNAANLDECLNSCMKHGYTLGLQLHKILAME